GTAKARNYYEMSLENSRKQDIAEKDVIVGTSAASAAKTVMSAKVSAGWYYIEVEDGERFTNKTYTIKATFAAATTATSTKPAPATTPQNASASKWSRLAGSGALDTMRKIVQAGWANNSGGTVVIATKGGHYDALSAAGVAGVERAPILLTDKNTLSSQTRAELVRIKPRKVIIVGGTGAISAAVANQIKAATGVTPKRIFGATASDTANALNMAYEDKWRGETAFLVTQKSYHDALSIAPIAYAKKMPIFLAKDANTIDHATLRAMDECDIDNVIIVGGPVAVSKKVENILRANDMSVKRLAGSNAYTTSKAVAQWGVTQGLSANKMGVATTNGYHDAVCGAALCGKSASVLVLADDKNSANSSVAKTYKSKIARGYVFGGELAVGKKTYDAFNAATR
ncbi:MAG: cell wall-binding repeat-containing protein, partial [Eggerthellaceae bacterium]|nr:cell wall-binding repeat-containing protein [Eggerthellaceae bacterium]